MSLYVHLTNLHLNYLITYAHRMNNVAHSLLFTIKFSPSKQMWKLFNLILII